MFLQFTASVAPLEAPRAGRAAETSPDAIASSNTLKRCSAILIHGERDMLGCSVNRL
jgi:hypothetical protein